MDLGRASDLLQVRLRTQQHYLKLGSAPVVLLCSYGVSTRCLDRCAVSTRCLGHTTTILLVGYLDRDDFDECRSGHFPRPHSGKSGKYHP